MKGLLFFQIFGVWVSPALASLSRSYSCRDLLTAADTIIVGEVVAGTGRHLGPAKKVIRATIAGSPDQRAIERDAQVYSAQVHVDRLIKGSNISGEVDVSFYGPGAVDLPPRRELLLFLRKTERGMFVFDMDNGQFYLSQKPNGPVSAQSADLLLTNELKVEANKGGPTARSAIRCLSQLGAVSTEELAALKESSDRTVRSVAIAELAAQGDLSAAHQMVDMLNSGAVRNPKSMSADDKQMVADFIEAIWALNRRRDPSLAMSLTPLLTHRNPAVQDAAVRALRSMKNPDTFPALAPLLDDKNLNNRYAAGMAICEFANPNRRGCPSKSRFKQNPDKYGAEWKKLLKKIRSKTP